MADRCRVLGVGVHPVNYAEATDRILAAARARQAFGVSALAVHGVMTGVLDPEHRYRLNSLDLVVPDGQPVRWALNLAYNAGCEDRVYGPSLMLEVCGKAAEAGLSIYLFGSRPEVLERLTANLCSQFPGLSIAGATPSRFRSLTEEENDELVREIRESGASIAFVGLGCPRQEVWAYENREALSMPIIAVGAAYDFHAGLLPQAPRALQNAGLEWLYRLWQEPRRLWRRYVYLNPLYLGLLALQMLGLRRFDCPGTPSAARRLYG